MCWWILRKSTTALRRRFEPFLRRATRRWARRSFFCAWRYRLGFSISASSDSVAKEERTEARETGLLAAPYPSQERLEGLIQPAEHILAAGEVGQSEQPFFPYRLQLLGLVVVVDALAANFPSIAPFLKGSVVEELVLEKPNLGLVGVQAVFVGEAHKQEYNKSIGLRN